MVRRRAARISQRRPCRQALERIRSVHGRHTRYRRHESGGTEAPLQALRYNTGWFDIGILERDRDVWLDPIGRAIMERPFEFVSDPLSPRQIPGKGDQIRLYQGGPISIMDFGSRGEAMRNRRPTHGERSPILPMSPALGLTRVVCTPSQMLSYRGMSIAD